MSFIFADVDGTNPAAGSQAAGAEITAAKQPRKRPQETLNDFWDSLITKKPGKVFQIFPRSLYANLLPPSKPEGVASKKGAAASYNEAAQECREKVRSIVKECRRTNEKFTDPDFDIENDWNRNTLQGLPLPTKNGGKTSNVGGAALRNALSTLVTSQVLGQSTSLNIDAAALQSALEDDDSDDEDNHMYPATAHRVDWIFDEPAFLVDGFSSSDVQQGANGDCWWVAAVANLCSMPELMDKVCVERDAECGVYGFVFYRDGEWISTVIDDNLYMRYPDFDAWGDFYDASGEKERKHKQRYQTGSEALYFAKCQDENETWLPLLEKAYAKVHGDYHAIQGGDSGEAVEDMTGGVSTVIMTNRILSKDKLWEELLRVNKDFIFAASSPYWGRREHSRQGIALNHAYSILKAVEVTGEDDKKVRLVLIRNPWGKRAWNGIGEWSGPWSDGSKEWTPYWMKKLDHKFGDDGIFWMSFSDLCRKYEMLHRTRLFDDKWVVVQQWTSVNVSWVSGYLTTKFVVEVKKSGTVVIALSQLDSRYFKGLEGQYRFHLQFLLQCENAKSGEYLVRASSSQEYWPDRSISAEIDLEPGVYEVLPKISAMRDTNQPIVEDVVKKAAEENPQKLRQIGLNYDVAHAKGGFEAEEEERKAKEKAKEEKRKKKLEEEKAAKEKAEKEKAKEEKTEKKEETAEKAKEEGSKGEKKVEDAEKKEGAAEKAKEEGSKDEKKADDTEKKEADGKVDEDKKSDDVAKEKTDDKKTEQVEGGEGDKKPEGESATEEKDNENPWNAVAVIGLRVYSKDHDLTIKLVKPKDPEEAAILDVGDKISGAGATT